MSKTIKVKSPGRINLIGEHTDYNDGFVLPAAIDKQITFSLQKNENIKNYNCSVIAGNMEEAFEFDIRQFAPLENGGWQNYVLGVINELKKSGATFTGFRGRFKGTVPIGGGMSSSAALECSLAFALNELFELGFTKWQLIKASQMAEHHFVGIKCGIMDQFASMMGKKNQVMLLDCRSLDYQYFPLELGEYQLILLNSNVSHELASSEYNVRRKECEDGVTIIKKQFPNIIKLRDVTTSMLAQSKLQLPEIIFKRCHHVITENQRVLDATAAIQKNDHQLLGQLMYQSHFSLQHDYEVSCPELDFLVDFTLDNNKVLGSRMMGGGFGGCTINIIEKKATAHFVNSISDAYFKKFSKSLTPYEVSIEDGTEVIKASVEH